LHDKRKPTSGCGGFRVQIRNEDLSEVPERYVAAAREGRPRPQISVPRLQQRGSAPIAGHLQAAAKYPAPEIAEANEERHMRDYRARIIGHTKQLAGGNDIELSQRDCRLRGSTASRAKAQLELNIFAASLSY
jgi:hypothetical protein